ncbi:MAG: hypothetical protein JWO57_3214, partial [Pseudonocardiales bacterium]|nr:hypothetical protein [Pseudonocardiales bacterium]
MTVASPPVTEFRHITVRRLTPAIGAEVTGVSLNEVTDEVFE